MKVAHFDCFSGISGDMVLGALIDAGVPADTIRTAIASLGLPIELEIERVRKCGIAATKVNVIAPDQEDYRFLPDVEAIIDRGSLTDRQRTLAKAIFRKLAEAEAKVHGMPVEKVHFHEVGALDSIADIVGCAVGLDWLGVVEFTSRSVPTGSGMVKCAHGLMPIPAPATAELLRGCPLAATDVKGELTTPTGAAILSTVVKTFTDTPVMTVTAMGHGAGTKDLMHQPNVLRLLVGTQADTGGTVVSLETNLDDCSPEVIGYCFERLFEAGALDVYLTPIQMKKNRPGTLLTVLANPAQVEDLEAMIFRETGTFGIRRTTMQRTILERESIVVETPFGPVKAKRGWRGPHSIVTPEYDDCARLARELGVPLREIYRHVPGNTSTNSGSRRS